MARLRQSFLIAIILTTLWPSMSAAADQIVMAITALPPLVAVDGTPGYFDLLVREAFARLGLEAQVENFPGDRSLRMTNEGLADGQALRIIGIEKEYPNLVRVPEPVYEAEFLAWSMRRDTQLAGWQDLHSLVVGYPLGWKLYDHEVKQAHEIIRVQSMEQLFPMLAASRLDVVLLDRWQAMYLTRRAGVDAHPIEPALARCEMYMYLHVRHRALVAPLAAALAAMRADGSIKRIHDQTLKGYDK
jgi:polar amino acid transport system substrate-binding protein